MDGEGQKAFTRLIAILLVTGVARGLVVRRPAADAPPGRPASLELLSDSAAAMALAEERRTRPLEPGERMDPNSADAEELDRVPGVGPSTADAILAARDSAPFTSLSDLRRVRGLGARTIERLAPYLALESGPAGASPVGFGNGRARGSSRSLPLSPNPAPRTAEAQGKGPVNLNRASEEELQSLPGIGPVLARRLIERRDEVGPYRSDSDLLSVSGIGPAMLARLKPRVRY